jgi:hypothetical protein
MSNRKASTEYFLKDLWMKSMNGGEETLVNLDEIFGLLLSLVENKEFVS